jgi:hypothetical protein
MSQRACPRRRIGVPSARDHDRALAPADRQHHRGAGLLGRPPRPARSLDAPAASPGGGRPRTLSVAVPCAFPDSWLGGWCQLFAARHRGGRSWGRGHGCGGERGQALADIGLTLGVRSRCCARSSGRSRSSRRNGPRVRAGATLSGAAGWKALHWDDRRGIARGRSVLVDPSCIDVARPTGRTDLRRSVPCHQSSAEVLRACGREAAARRVERYASRLRLRLDEPEATRTMWSLHRHVRGASGFSYLRGAPEGAMSLCGADFGNVQLWSPARGGCGSHASRASTPTSCATSRWSTVIPPRADGRRARGLRP